MTNNMTPERIERINKNINARIVELNNKNFTINTTYCQNCLNEINRAHDIVDGYTTCCNERPVNNIEAEQLRAREIAFLNESIIK